MEKQLWKSLLVLPAGAGLVGCGVLQGAIKGAVNGFHPGKDLKAHPKGRDTSRCPRFG